MIRRQARHFVAIALPILAVLGVATAQAQDGSIKIAVVDIQVVVGQSTAGQELQQRLSQFQQAAQQELRQQAEAMQALGQQVASATDQAEAARLRKQYEDETLAAQRLRDDKQREGQKMQEEGLRAIEKEIAPIFEAVQASEGYDLILARTPGLTLMVSDRVDITQLVIDRYNAVE